MEVNNLPNIGLYSVGKKETDIVPIIEL
jgi:hypothetical protein